MQKTLMKGFRKNNPTDCSKYLDRTAVKVKTASPKKAEEIH